MTPTHTPVKSSAQQIKRSGNGEDTLLLAGCFCPPHAGHFANLEKHIDEVDKVVIAVYNPEKTRHGVPVKVSVEIWKVYLDELLTDLQRQKVELIVCNEDDDVFTCGVNFALESNVESGKRKPRYLNVLVGSDYTPARVKQLGKRLDGSIDKFEKKKRTSSGIYVNMFVTQRIQDLSATEFISCLQDLLFPNCKQFLPPGLAPATKRDIVQYIRDNLN
jgi:hypothetical protein